MESMGKEVSTRLDREIDHEKQKVLQHLLTLSGAYIDL
jgi:hypothetical protein